MEERKYLKWYNKVGYGSGDIAGNVVYAFLTSFVMIYLTDTIGLNAGIVGTLIAVSKLFDGVSDIFFGSMIDRTKSKMGKARPWMFYGFFGCAVTLFGVFATICRLGIVVAGYLGSIPLMLVFTVLTSLGEGPWQGDVGAVIANCSEHTYLKTGKRIDGSMFSCTSFGTKLGGGIGVALSGWLLDASGYVNNAAVQSASCISMMNVMYLWLPFAFDLIITIILSFMNIEGANEQLKESME